MKTTNRARKAMRKLKGTEFFVFRSALSGGFGSDEPEGMPVAVTLTSLLVGVGVCNAMTRVACADEMVGLSN